MRDIGIGELAERAQVPVANIRHCEEIGIRPKPARGNGRHLSFEEPDVTRLNFINTCRELSNSLDQAKIPIQLSEPQNPKLQCGVCLLPDLDNRRAAEDQSAAYHRG